MLCERLMLILIYSQVSLQWLIDGPEDLGMEVPVHQDIGSDEPTWTAVSEHSNHQRAPQNKGSSKLLVSRCLRLTWDV